MFFIQHLLLHSRYQIKKGQLLIPYFVHPWFACWTLKNPKILFSPHGVARTSRIPSHNPFGHRSTQNAFFSQKKTKMPLVNLGLIEGQTRSKSTQNNTFCSSSSNLSFKEIFSHFNQVWSEVDFGWAQKPKFWFRCWNKLKPMSL